MNIRAKSDYDLFQISIIYTLLLGQKNNPAAKSIRLTVQCVTQFDYDINHEQLT